MLTFAIQIAEPPVGIFGVPLEDSIQYANVAISLTNEQGQSYVYGYVPIVIAKCGVYLKEKGMTGLKPNNPPANNSSVQLRMLKAFSA